MLNDFLNHNLKNSALSPFRLYFLIFTINFTPMLPQNTAVKCEIQSYSLKYGCRNIRFTNNNSYLVHSSTKVDGISLFPDKA